MPGTPKAATDRYHELSQQIKEIENRIAEIAELKKHIINYAQTKDIYREYWRSGNSVGYYEVNVEKILLHQSAKDAFNKFETDRIPTLKNLKQEIILCNGMKQACWKEYSLLKKQTKEILTVKSNIDRLLTIKEIDFEIQR